MKKPRVYFLCVWGIYVFALNQKVQNPEEDQEELIAICQRSFFGDLRGMIFFEEVQESLLVTSSAKRLKSKAENETKKIIALKSLKRGKQTVEEIAEDAGLSVAEVEQLAGLKIV